MRKSIPGVHRIKACPDSAQLKRWMRKAGVTQEQLARELESRTGRRIDTASMSRRMRGMIPFKADEVAAMAEFFTVPYEDVLRAVGGIRGGAPATGVVDDEGYVAFLVNSKESRQTVRFKTADALNEAVLTVKMCPKETRSAPRGIYLVQITPPKIYLRQVLDRVGGKWITASLFGDPKIEQTEDLVFIATAIHLQFA